ncbi:iron ABC transporter permease [Rapidithrix thailandica]|uniref:Iron ABC transporter permease n=1 Tax=Rapidithrix thailandica TaxID=413964 RepID=A0AAW9S3M8_9BACT
MQISTEHRVVQTPSSRGRQLLWITGFFVLSLGLFLGDLLLGSVKIPITEALRVLGGVDIENQIWENILLKIRLPKALTAVFAGGALSVAGLQMQTLFRNPLAGPSVLGITAGASLGVALVMLGAGNIASVYSLKHLGLTESWLLAGAAFAGASLVMLVILAVASVIRDNVVLLIVGLMVGNITISLVAVWQYFSNPEEIKDYVLWTFGSVEGVTGDQLIVLGLAVLVGLVLAFLASKPLNMLLLGENYARSLGLGVRQIRFWVILCVSLLAGSVTGFCGPIGFIGIAVPHLTRALLNSSDHRLIIPGACFLGIAIMLACDIIAHVPGSSITLPMNAITALIGSPVVIWVIMKRRKLQQ